MRNESTGQLRSRFLRIAPHRILHIDIALVALQGESTHGDVKALTNVARTRGHSSAPILKAH
jgi:hypothetical protein